MIAGLTRAASKVARLRILARFAVLWLVGLLLVSAVTPAALAAGDDDGAPEEEFPLLGLDVLLGEVDTVHPDILSQATLASPRVDELSADLSLAHFRLERASRARVLARAEQARLAALIGQTRGRIATWRQAEHEYEDEVERLEGVLVGFSVASYTDDDPQTRLEDGFGESLSPVPFLLEQAQLELEADLVAAKGRMDEARRALARLLDERLDLVGAINEAVRKESRSTGIKTESEATISELTPRLADAVLLAPLDGLEFPVLVLDAYYRAQLLTAERFPLCELTWNQLAGVGRVETVHGTYGGSTVRVGGEVVPHILGVVLDGTRFSAIPDTDGGRMDGNTEWDRAVGPMQFIPSSWEIYGVDGNEDGNRDPHNLYDAAAAAGEHLCRGHSGLQSPAAFTSSLLGYNHSPAYGVEVGGYADLYASRLDLSPDNRPETVDVEGAPGEQDGEDEPAPIILAASES